MFLSACSLAFFWLPTSERVYVLPPFDPARHLATTDVEFLPGEPSPGLRLRIKFSKTDSVGAGHFLYIGVTSTNLCLVLALRSYLAHRGSLAGPLFVWADRSPLTANQVNHYLRIILSRAGVSGPFSSHSFRIGAATSAAVAGLPDHLIQTLGRWTSQTYRRYIRTAPDTLLSVAPLL